MPFPGIWVCTCLSLTSIWFVRLQYGLYNGVFIYVDPPFICSEVNPRLLKINLKS